MELYLNSYICEYSANMEAQKNDKKNFGYLLLALLLVSVIVNVYQWRVHGTSVVKYDDRIDSMIVVRVEVEKELASTEVELEKYRGISANLDSLLNDANQKVSTQELHIRDLIKKEKDAGRLSKKLKQELEELRKMRDEYLEKIDQLVTENKELKSKNEELNTSVSNLSEEKKSLQSKVSVGAQLKAEYLKVQSYKKKGSGRFVESSLAKKTNKLEVCLTILDNKLANKGDKVVYMVITEPTGKVLAGQSRAVFQSADQGEISATASYKINYNGEKQELCMSFETDQRILTSGNYNVDIYIDGSLVGNKQYLLE